MKSFFFIGLFITIQFQISYGQFWATGWNTLGDADNANAIANDNEGNIYAAGSVYYTSGSFDTLTSGGYLAKFSPAGNLLWAHPAGSSAHGLFIDSKNNLYVTGSNAYNSFIGDTTLPVHGGVNGDIFVAKFDSSGNIIWANSGGGNQGDIGRSVTVDLQGNVLITGSFVDTAYFDTDSIVSSGGANTGDIFIAKYDSSGTFNWVRSAGGHDDFDSGNGISCDGSGNLYVTGSFRDSAYFGSILLISSGIGDIFIAKYDPFGNPLWAKNDGVSFNIDGGLGVITDLSGNSFITGKYNNAAYVSKFNSIGQQEWMQIAQSGILESARAIALDDSGRVYITGDFEQSISFIGSSTVFSNGASDIFIAHFSSTGNFEWMITGGGNDYDVAGGICIDDSNSVISCGRFVGVGNFGNVSLVARDSIYTSAYFLRTSGLINSVEQSIYETSISVFPNPFTNQIRIRNSKDNYLMTVNDISSRPVFTFNLTENQEQVIDLNFLKSGVYFLRAIDLNGNVMYSKIMIKGN